MTRKSKLLVAILQENHSKTQEKKIKTAIRQKQWHFPQNPSLSQQVLFAKEDGASLFAVHFAMKLSAQKLCNVATKS